MAIQANDAVCVAKKLAELSKEARGCGNHRMLRLIGKEMSPVDTPLYGRELTDAEWLQRGVAEGLFEYCLALFLSPEVKALVPDSIRDRLAPYTGSPLDDLAKDLAGLMEAIYPLQSRDELQQQVA